MGILDKIFGKKSDNNKLRKDADTNIRSEGNGIKIGNIGEISFGSPYVGDSTGSSAFDFYVYEWFIKDTGEVFYVGKGRGDRYKEFHERAYEAEKIKRLYDTGCTIVKSNLNEEEALELETKEMTRILNETDHRLTNRIIPYFTKRDNGYSRAMSTPALQFQIAPVLYASEIDEHYFGTKWKPFDTVDTKMLSSPMIWDKNISAEVRDIVYGGDYEKYYSEVTMLLEMHGSRILKSKYAKSVSAWIYPFDDYVVNHEIAEKNAKEKIGRYVPTYHLIDVWKALIALYGLPELPSKESNITINPINNRVPLSEIRNLHNWEKGYDEGHDFWERGDIERKNGNVEEAIKLFDKARYNGYFAPALYNSYAMAYRKLKDPENEISILEEAIERFRKEDYDTSQIIVKYENQRNKAINKLRK